MPKVKPNFKTKRKHFIKKWRKFRGLTLEELGEIVGVTAGALSQLEKGDIQYTQPMLEALADALACPGGPPDLLIRNPLDEEDPMAIWVQIEPAQRERALNILKTFIPKKAA